MSRGAWERKMGKRTKGNYIKGYFLRLFLLVAVLVSVMGIALLRFSKRVVGDEIIKLHQTILRSTAGETASVLGGLRESLLEIAENVQLTEWLESGVGDESEIDRLTEDEIYLNFKRGNPLRVYIYDQEKLRYSSDRREVPWEEVRGQLSPSGEEEDFWMAGPVRVQEEGLYRNSFFMIQRVRNLLNGRTVGYVCFQFSEKSLYDSYSRMRESGRDYYIADSRGVMVSGDAKNEIGIRNVLGEDGGVLDGAGYRTEKSGTDNVLCFYEPIRGTDWYMMEKADVRGIWESLDRVGYFAAGLIALFLVSVVPMTFLSWKNIVKPVGVIKEKMGQVAEGDLEVSIDPGEKGKGEFAEIADSFNDMTERLAGQVEEIREIERKKHLLELDFLQAQINPHFIYNTLSSIRFYVEMGKNEEAEEMLIDFSKILRKTLSRSEKFISLGEEIETIVHYVNLQRRRYRERFQVEFDIQENTKSSLVPDFILQPIVENAIFYSLRQDRICHIQIRSWIQDKDLYVSVRDDGVGMEAEKISEILGKDLSVNKVGVRNVNERLKLNFGAGYGLRIQSEKGKGTEVILVMPSTAERGRGK